MNTLPGFDLGSLTRRQAHRVHLANLGIFKKKDDNAPSSGSGASPAPSESKIIDPNSIVYFNEKFSLYKDAKINPGSETVQYGNNVFEGIISYWNEEQKQLYVFRLDDHYKRLVESGKYLKIELKETSKDFKNIVVNLLKKNSGKNHTYIRPFAYRDEERVALRCKGKTGFIIYTIPLDMDLSIGEGLNVCKAKRTRPDIDSVPFYHKVGGNYTLSAREKSDAIEAGFNDAIFFTRKGKVSEATISNIFIVNSAGELITPPKSANILMGITRDTVLKLADKLGVKAKEKDISEADLRESREAVLTGTYVGMTPIVTFEKNPIGNGQIGPVFKALHKKYFDIAFGRADHKEWLTPVF